MTAPPSPATIRGPNSDVSLNGPLQIHADHLVEQFLACLQRRRRDRRESGVIDQHVDAAPARIDFFNEPIAVLPFADVRPHAPSRRCRARGFP